MIVFAPFCAAVGFFLGVIVALMLRIHRHPDTKHWQEIGWRKGFYVRVIDEPEAPPE